MACNDSNIGLIFRVTQAYENDSAQGKLSYLTLQDKLFASFDPQQDAFLVLDLCLLNSHYLLHG